MSGLAATRRDLAALGAQAPLRVVYELGKRSGLHGLALRGVSRSARPAALRVLDVFRPRRPLSVEAVDRCLLDARLIIDEGHRVFGTRVPISSPADWNVLPTSGASWPSGAFWWQIDIRSDQRLGDVKWTWELGRHRDLVVLARAAYLDPEGPWLGELSQRLRWWFEASPPEIGVHWYSNLEIALRVMAWIQIFALTGSSLPGDVVRSMSLHVGSARRHLLIDFPYTASSMRNNHLLGDALGLLAIQTFSSADQDSLLSRIADQAFFGQLRRHMRPDGSMIEDSLSYHRFVLEMLAMKFLLGDHSEATATSLRHAAEHLRRLGVLDGQVPQYGDWDEGRVLASSGDALDVGGSVALALALTGQTEPVLGSVEREECDWYAGTSIPAAESHASHPLPHLTPVVSGGIAHVVRGDWSVWLKSGSGPSHQHADLLHVSVRYKQDWVLVDPGTGTYNGDLEVRNAFRTSRAHNGLRARGQEMFVPHRAFRWLTSANVTAGPPMEVGSAVVLWGLHDAFVATGQGERHARAVVVTEGGVTCIDWREKSQDADLTVALAPETAITGDALILRKSQQRLVLNGLDGAQQRCGELSPFAGAHSVTYGRWDPAIWLDLAVAGRGPTRWGVGVAGGEHGSARVEGEVVLLADLSISLAFEEDHSATLRVSVGDIEFTSVTTRGRL